MLSQLLTALASFSAATKASPTDLQPRQAATKITVNLAQRYQTIDGFGISGAFQRANLIVNLAEPKRSQLVDLLFNTTTGAGFTIVRNGIGSSVDSRSDWMNSILPKSPGSPTAEPQYVWDGKDSGQLWVSQQAVKYGVKTFYADAWSAPGFMKTNNNDANGGRLCGSPGGTCSSGDWRQAYANYLVKYVQLYQEAGVPITHLGFLNEPDLSTSYASMQMDGNQAADFIKILRPTLDKANLTSTGIACCDATGWSAQSSMTQQIKSSGAEGLLQIITAHTYSSGVGGPISTTRKVWQTEASDLNGRWSTAWYTNGGAGDGFTWANNIYTGLAQGNCSGYLFWEAVQDRATNNNNNEKLILVDGGNYEVSKRLWAFAQYSRTVKPNAVRLGTTAGNLRVTAFQNPDGSVAVNVLNSGSGTTNLNVVLSGFNATSVQSWQTDNQKDMVDTPATIGTDGSITGAVTGRGMVSFVIR